MASTLLTSKLRLNSGLNAVVVNPPQGYMKALTPEAKAADITDPLEDQYDWMQLFVQNKAQLESLVPRTLKALKQDSLLGIAFPKGSSKIQTDLTRDAGWESLRNSNLKWINLVSVDDTWSAFSLRPYHPGEARQSFR